MDTTTTEHQTNEDVSQKMEDEHLRLQRQVRIIQSDREERQMGVHPQFRRQDHLMRILKKDYLNFIKDIKVARSGAHKKKNLKMKADLKRALLYRIQMEQDGEEGLFMMSQVEQLLRRQKKQMIELRQSFTTCTGQLEERRYLSEHRLMSTENKLETAMKRFNVIQCENRRIRDEIEHTLKDRAIFNQAWLKMLTILGKGKKFLLDLFESSTLAYDQRDEWVRKLRSLQDKGKMDQMLQVQEMRDLQKAFDHEMKLHTFLARKGVVRVNRQQEEREVAHKTIEVDNNKKDIEAHRQILHQIFDYTQEDHINKIIDAFKLIEQNNLSLYTLLTHQCAESEVLKRDLQHILREIGDRKEYNEKKDDERTSQIKDLEEKLQKQRERTEEIRKKDGAAINKLKGTMVKVEELFKMLNCSMEPFQNLLGDKGPSLNHMDLTFRLITEKIKEYIELTYYYERSMHKKDKKSSRLKKFTIHSDYPKFSSIPTIDFYVTANPCPACVEARWMSRVTEQPEVPFDKAMVLDALRKLSEDPAFVKSDRVHPLTDCRVPQSRYILAKRYT